MDLTKITIIETELSVPRKGSVRVRINLKNRILSWRESNRWNRNFTRTINMKEVEEIRAGFERCGIQNWPLFYPDEAARDTLQDSSQNWSISVYTDDIDPIKVWQGGDIYPKELPEWLEINGTICRQPFVVLD